MHLKEWFRDQVVTRRLIRVKRHSVGAANNTLNYQVNDSGPLDAHIDNFICVALVEPVANSTAFNT